jgi:hypothetical protein
VNANVGSRYRGAKVLSTPVERSRTDDVKLCSTLPRRKPHFFLLTAPVCISIFDQPYADKHGASSAPQASCFHIYDRSHLVIDLASLHSLYRRGTNPSGHKLAAGSLNCRVKMPSTRSASEGNTAVSSNYVRLTGSERRPSPGATLRGRPDPDEKILITIVLRRRPDEPLLPELSRLSATPACQRQLLSQEDFAATLSPNWNTKNRRGRHRHHLDGNLPSCGSLGPMPSPHR